MLKRIELLLIVLAILALNLHLLLWSGAEILTIVSLAGLALFYPFLSLALFLDDDQTIKINNMLPGLPFSIALVGILFKIQNWPGFQINLIVGTLGLVFLIIHRFTQKNELQKVSYKIITKRAIPLLIITLFMLALPKYAWIETKYSEYPEYIKTIKELDKTPESIELQQQLDSLNNHLIH